MALIASPSSGLDVLHTVNKVFVNNQHGTCVNFSILSICWIETEIWISHKIHEWHLRKNGLKIYLVFSQHVDIAVFYSSSKVYDLVC